MKNWKHWAFVAVIAIVGIIMGFVACDNNSGNNDPKTFTVTFHANGGTPEPAQQTIDKDGKATEPPAMTKTNNDFDGWYKESAFTTQWIFATNTVTANVDLYAKWTPYYGTLPNTTIKIYKGDAGVTDVQMTSAVTITTNAFGRLTQADKTAVNNTLTKILILSDKEYTWDGHILGIQFDLDEEILLGGLQAIAGDSLPLAE